MKILKAIHNTLKKIETVIGVVIFATIVIIVVLQVALRFGLGKSILWAVELSELLFIYLSFIMADVVYKDRGHIKIDYFYGKLSSTWKSLVSIVSYVLILVLFLYSLPESITLIKMQSGHTLAVALPLNKSYWTFPVLIAFSSMIFTTIYYIVEEVLNFNNNGLKKNK